MQGKDAALRELAATTPLQFDDGGAPVKGSKAAALRREIDRAASSRWPDILRGSDERIAALETKVGQLVDQHSIELATREFRAAEAVLDELDEPAERILELIGRLKGHEAQLIRICSMTRGQRLDGRDVYWDANLDALRGLLEHHAGLKPPRSVHLSPLVGEEPRLRRAPDGGWIEHWGNQALGEQPEKLEPRR